jgi:UDP-N-acetylmuramoylalanine--D-glutamate ligase
MIPAAYASGEIAVIGLAKSGRAAAELLARRGARVYASDAGRGGAIDEAATALRAAGVAVDLGAHDLERVARAALVVASPGVPPDAPPLAAAAAAGVPVVGELEVALWFIPALRYVAITGTNGKTTTTALAAHLLRAVGREGAVAAGNIGTPLAELALRDGPAPWVALEVSSFQLHDTPSIAPDVGVLTNLSANHLDRYASLAEYYGDKRLLFRNATGRSRWVLNADDTDVAALADRVAGCRHWFSTRRADVDATFDRARRQLVVLGEPLLPREQLMLFGDHNVENALAAALAVMLADPAHRTAEARRRLAAGLRSFRALEHRLEPVGEFDGVLWINDSKSTNVASTLVAVAGMTRPTVLLLGGRHKGEPYTALAAPAKEKARAVVAYGESAPIIEGDLAPLVPVERVNGTFPEVIAQARALARPGDAILLSPACSSYDMFKNYEQRGAEFKRLAAGGR